VKNGHPVAQRHRLCLVVGDIQGNDADSALDAGDLGAHLHAQLGSRLESGSSIKNTDDSRTIARPMATRWRWPPELAGL
jgi:hypothetical protein